MNRLDVNTMRVLVVDDEVFMRKLVVRLASEIGIKEIDMAEDGHQAMDLVMRSRTPYDLIICDLEMPVMNGFEFVRFLRTKAPKNHRRAPVIILTGHSSSENLQEAVDLGINGFLVKPVSRQKLESRMIAAITRPPIGAKIPPGR